MRLKFIGILLLFTIFATSCGSDDSVTESPVESNESTLSIAGTSYDVETNALSTSISLVVTIGTNERTMTLESNEGVSQSTGTFSVPGDYTVTYADGLQNAIVYIMQSGTINITEIGNNSLSGTLDVQGNDVFDNTQVISISGNFNGPLIKM